MNQKGTSISSKEYKILQGPNSEGYGSDSICVFGKLVLVLADSRLIKVSRTQALKIIPVQQYTGTTVYWLDTGYHTGILMCPGWCGI